MILTAHQPAYLPWLGLLAKIAAADRFVLLDTVALPGRGGSENGNYENRQRIKTATGVQWLTVPVRRAEGVPLKDVLIANDQPWQRKHWRALELAYQGAPHFDLYAPELKHLLSERRWERLADLDLALLRFHLDHFGIDTEIVRASDLNPSGAKSELILDLCRKLRASGFIFGAHGREYADVAAFGAAGVRVTFQDFRHPEYPQLHGAFVPGMAALDLLLNVGPESGRVLEGA